MKARPRIRDTVKRLDAALAMVRQDRWQVSGLRAGRLVILAEGAGTAAQLEPAQRRVQELVVTTAAAADSTARSARATSSTVTPSDSGMWTRATSRSRRDSGTTTSGTPCTTPKNGSA